tara:strand:+ start:831 stop:1481 length:651 start_codon:yes stop_codon:yes gene_type:complete
MAYLKRQKIGKFWPIARKGTKYVARSTHDQHNSIPLIVVMRDILKIVRNKKELKRSLNEKQILINNKEIRETNYPINLFDIVNFVNKNYRASLSENKKMIFEEISDKEAETKVYKIISRKLLSKNKIQLNLMQGKNILSDEKAKTGDSVVLNLKENKIEKIIPMEKGKTGFALKGKHMGSVGEIVEIMERGGKSIAKIKSKDGNINVWVKNIIVIK